MYEPFCSALFYSHLFALKIDASLLNKFSLVTVNAALIQSTGYNDFHAFFLLLNINMHLIVTSQRDIFF